MDYPNSLNNLIESFETLPGIGRKTAERLALYVFSELNENTIQKFSKSLTDVTTLKTCNVCHSLSDNDICNICSNSFRDQDIILVVENIKDVFVFEKTKTFTGVYHVLNGSINFANNIGVEDLNINSLLNRVKNNNIKEVILATNASTTGEVTAQYIKNILEEHCNVTRLAYGLSVGSDISYTDEVTLKKAIEGRNKL